MSACGIIVLWKEYSIPLSDKNITALFKSLILQGNAQEKRCPGYDNLKENYKERLL